MPKRPRPRKPAGSLPPPPDRKEFERQGDDMPPPPLQRLRIEHLRFETFERPKIEQAEQAQKRKLERIERDRELARKRLEESLRPPRERISSLEWPDPRPRPGFADQRPDGPSTSDILVPMRCAANKTPFMLRFKWLGAVWGSPETIIIRAARSAGSGNATSFSLDKLDFRMARCACGARCSPIRCGSCQQYLCDGGVELLPNGGRLHHCACGNSGLLQSNLKEVSGSKSAGAQAPGNTDRNPLQLPFKGS